MKNTNCRRLANLWWLPLFVVGWGGFTFGGWPKWIYGVGMGGLVIYLVVNTVWQERRHRRPPGRARHRSERGHEGAVEEVKITDVSYIPAEEMTAGWIVLDRIEPGAPKPDYCIHGRTVCMADCKEWVWLGHTTHEMVKDKGYRPICVQCANKYLKRDADTKQFTDHKRADGPH